MLNYLNERDFPRNGTPRTLQCVSFPPSVMAFSPDGSRLFAACDLGAGIIWDVRREHGEPGEGN